MEENAIRSSFESASKATAAGLKKVANMGIRGGLNIVAPGSGEIYDKATKGLEMLRKGIGGKGKDNSARNILIIGLGVVLLLIVVIAAIISPFVEAYNVGVSIFSPSSKSIYLIKDVSPTAMSNQELYATDEIEVKYTITIGAPTTDLFDIRVVSESFKLIKNNGEITQIDVDTDAMVTELNQQIINQFDRTIKHGHMESLPIFSLTLPAGNITKADLEDSMLVNTIILEAQVLGISGHGIVPKQVEASATVTIGSPSVCFTFTGPWTDEEKNKELAAIGTLLSKSNKFTSNLCKNPVQPIELFRNRISECCFIDKTDKNKIHITNGCKGTLFNSSEALLYSLAHESGHVFAYRNRPIFNAFVVEIFGIRGRYTNQKEPFLCSYPIDTNQVCASAKWPPNSRSCIEYKISEDFAETIAIHFTYLSYPSFSYEKCGNQPINLEQEYPIHYGFIRKNLY